jgi:hypothetical protein
MVVAKVYNNNKRYLKFVIFRVSNVSGMFERLRRLILTNTIAAIKLLDQCHCPLGPMESQMH